MIITKEENMQFCIKATGKMKNQSGEEEKISIHTGMIGPAIEAIAEVAMINFVRKCLENKGVPLALTDISATMLLPDELEPARFKERLTEIFLNF